MTETQPLDIGLPDDLQFTRHGSGIEFSWRWFEWQVLFMTAFVVVWNGFLINWYSMWDPSEGLMMALFPLLHVGVGIVLTYWTLAGWLNRTRVLVGQGRMRVHSGPLPWLGNQELDSTALQQLYIQEKVNHGRNGPTIKYELHALTRDGKNLLLVRTLKTREQAIYLEQEIEKHLSIRDEPVRGQMAR
jgi:hypothetical protein